MLFQQYLLSKLPGANLYPFDKWRKVFFQKIMYQIFGNTGGPMAGKYHASHLQSVCSCFSFLKLLFPLQNKSYKGSKNHSVLCMQLSARKILLIMLLFARPAKKQDKNIKLVFFEISVFISK